MTGLMFNAGVRPSRVRASRERALERLSEEARARRESSIQHRLLEIRSQAVYAFKAER